MKSPRNKFLLRAGPVLGLALVIVAFTLLSDSPGQYLSIRNLRIILSQTVIVALGALGMTVIIISGGIDLSVGSVIALSGVITALGLRAGWATESAVCLGIASGLLVGFVNALMITRLRVVPFVATLGMLGIARGAAKWLGEEQTVNVPPHLGQQSGRHLPAASVAHRGSRRVGHPGIGGLDGGCSQSHYFWPKGVCTRLPARRLPEPVVCRRIA